MKITNTKKAQKELDQLQTRCKVRLLDIEQIEKEVGYKLKSLLSSGLTKKSLIGSQVTVQPDCSAFSASYNGIPESTHVSLEVTASGLKFLSASRQTVRPNHPVQITFDSSKTDEILNLLQK